MVNKRDLGDRFSRDVDNLLDETGLIETQPTSAEYDEVLSLARVLATTDFSTGSQTRAPLRRKLLNQINGAAVTTAEIPGPLRLLKNVFQLERHHPLPSLRRAGSFSRRLIVPALVLLLLIVGVATLISPLAGPITTSWQGIWPFDSFGPAVDNRPGPVETVSPAELVVVPTVKWQFRGAGGFSSDPVVAGGRLFAGSNAGDLYALDLHTGREQWRFRTKGAVTSAPAVVDGVLYTGSGDGFFYALRADSGREIWRTNIGGNGSSAPAVAAGAVYVDSADGYLYALDTTTGQVKWRFNTGDQVLSVPTVAGGSVYVGSSDWHVYALDADTGREQWRFKTGDWVSAAPLVAEVPGLGRIVFVGSHDQLLYALKAETGHEQWRFRAGDNVIAAPVLARGVLYFGSYDGDLYAVEASTGQARWQFETGKPIRSSPQVVNGVVHVGSDSGYLYTVEAATGREIWRFETESQISTSPAVAEGLIYVVSGKGNLYALQPEVRPAGSQPPTPAVSSGEQIDRLKSPYFQFTPQGWYPSTGNDVIHFQGRLTDEMGQPVPGFRIEADNGIQRLLSEPSAGDGTWGIVVPRAEEQSGWWWLTIVHCAGETGPNSQCQAVTRLSESVKVEVIYPTEVVINADWTCHRDCQLSPESEK